MLAVPQDHAAHVAHAGAVHQDLTRRHGVTQAAGLVGAVDDPADVADQDILRTHAHLPRQSGVLLQMALLTVNGDKVAGLGQGVDDLQLLAAGVARDVQALQLVVDHVGALAVKLVDDAGDGLFIAGNGGSGNDDLIAGLDLHLAVAGEGHTVQGGHIFALRAGGDDDDLVLGQGFDLVDVHQRSLGDVEIAQFRGHLQDVFHAAARNGHLAPVALGNGQDRLNAVHIGGEGGDDDAAFAALEVAVQTVGDDGFRRSIALALDVGGVHQQGIDALLAQVAEAAQISHAVLRRRIDLKVAGHDHGTHRRLDGKGHRVGNGVVDVDEFHGKAAGLDDVAGLVGDELGLGHHVMLLQLELDEAQRQRRGVDGGVDRLQNVGQGADVVLMAVGDEEAAQLLLVFRKIGNVGNDQVNAVHIVLREAEAAVHHDHILSVLQDGHVLSDLIQAAQRNNFQFICQYLTTPLLVSCYVFACGAGCEAEASAIVIPFLSRRASAKTQSP